MCSGLLASGGMLLRRVRINPIATNEVPMKKRVSMILVLILFSAAAILAQSYRGRIQGQVTDQSSAVVVGASVTLLNVNTGLQATRQTSGTGVYLFERSEERRVGKECR